MLIFSIPLIFVVANNPESMQEPQISMFVSMWKQELKPVTPLYHCLYGYVVQLMEDSKNPLVRS